MRRPFFSVVMPTYNRAQFLPLAIQSVLNQSFTDLEVVISSGGSTDNTVDVIAQFKDKRIRHIESKERLSIGDNYQKGLDNAAGEYITFLSDDDAFVPTMFERVKRVITDENASLVGFRYSFYYHNEDVEHHLQTPVSANTLVIPYSTGEVTKFEKQQAIKNLFNIYGLTEKGDRSERFIIPYLANAVYHRRIFSDLSRKREKLFDATPADMYLAGAVFFVSDSYYCLDDPLHVWSHWGGNATASPYQKGNELRKHYEKLLKGAGLNYTPLKFPLPHNLGANAVLQAKHDYAADNSGDFEIDWANYYLSVYDYLLYLKSKEVDISEEISEFHEVLSREKSELQQIVRSKISSSKFIAKQFVRKKLPFAKNFLKRVIQGKSAIEQTIICGDDAGFKTFLEAAQFLSVNSRYN